MMNLDFDTFDATFYNFEKTLPSRMAALDEKVVNDLKTNPLLEPYVKNFGQPIGATEKWVASIRTAAFNEALVRKQDSVLATDRIFLDAWESKQDISYVETKGRVQLQIERDGKKILTGTGSSLLFHPVSMVLDLPLTAMACFASSSDGNCVPAKIEGVVNLIKDVKVQNITKQVGVVSAHVKATPGHMTSGPVLHSKMSLVVSKLSEQNQQQLGTMIVSEAFSMGELDSVNSERLGTKTYMPLTQVHPSFKAYQTDNAKQQRIIQYAWCKPYAPHYDIKVTIPPKKIGPFANPMLLAQEINRLMGGTSIKKMAYGYGLCPGMTRQEAATVRFVTTAVPLFKKLGKLAIQGETLQLTMFYHTLVDYLKEEMKMPELDAKKHILQNVDLLRGPLKYAQWQQFKGRFNLQDKSPNHLVAYAPMSFSAQSTCEDTMKKMDENYDWMNGVSDYTIFKAVHTEQSGRHYYIDGLPDFFNTWESTAELSFLVKKKGRYFFEYPKPVPNGQLMAAFMLYAKEYLAFPFKGIFTRSERVLAVKGHAKLHLTVEGSGDVQVDDSSDLYVNDFSMHNSLIEPKFSVGVVIEPQPVQVPPFVASLPSVVPIQAVPPPIATTSTLAATPISSGMQPPTVEQRTQRIEQNVQSMDEMLSGLKSLDDLFD
jgi:hypothetical protein